MQLRDHEGVKGKRDAYPFDPRLLKIDSSYNVRDLSSPEAVEKLGELKESIRANGVRTPLEVRLDGEDVFIVAGHRRHKAVMDLIEEGAEIETVLVLHEPKGTNDAERTLNLVVSNSGEPLKPLEVAEVVRRLTAYGWDAGDIAKRLGWKSSASVKQHLDLLAMPETVKNHVRKGDISATLARNIAKSADPVEAEKMIQANLDENRRIKGKHQKVTPKTIKRDAKPPAPALPIEAAAPSPAPAESVAVFKQPPEPAPREELEDHLVNHINGDAEQTKGYPVIFNGDHAEFEREHANTPPKERPDWPLPSFDAKDWAEAFCRRFIVSERAGYDTKPVDEDVALMVSWFANALMRGFDEHAARAAKADGPTEYERGPLG